jgi:hypothetical protein
MVLDPSCKPPAIVTQELPNTLSILKVHYRFHWFLPLARSIQSIPSHHISLRFTLILSTHLRLGLSSGLFLSVLHK